MGFIGRKISIVSVLLAILLVNNALAFNVKKDSVRLNLRSHISPLSVINLKEVNKCGGGYCVLYEKSHRYTFVTPESFMVKIADGDAQVVGTPFKTGSRETDNGVIYEDSYSLRARTKYYLLNRSSCFSSRIKKEGKSICMKCSVPLWDIWLM